LFAKCEAEAVPSISEKLQISVVPSFVCLSCGKDFKLISKVEGANPQELNKAISMLSELPLPPNTENVNILIH
jgi:hypothetical protein